MSKIIIKLFLVLTLLITSAVKVYAQNSQETIVSPSIIDVTIGDIFEISIKNNSDAVKVYELESVEFIDQEDSNQINFSPNLLELLVESNQVEIAPLATTTIEVMYVNAPLQGIPGILVREVTGQGENVLVSPELLSLIVDSSVTNEELSNLQTGLEITSSTYNLFDYTLGLDPELKFIINVSNLTNKYINSTGDIIIKRNDIRIGQVLLTDKLPIPLIPSESVELEENIEVGNPGIFDKIELVQTITVDNKQIVNTNLIYIVNVPLVIGLIIFLLIVISSTIFLIIYGRRSFKGI